MSQNQEIIESKLCAYVDGELDAEGRAEIEKHLNANPQHRRLLESLRATRDLLRWLPREQAPPELAETLNGQLERSVLLDYEGDGLRIPIWPRIFAAAAIIALTVGLAAAVFYALPRSQKPALAIGNGAPSNDAREFGQPSAMPSTFSSDEAKVEGGNSHPLAEANEQAKDAGPGRELASANSSPAEVRKGGFTDLDFMDRAKKSEESPAAAAANSSAVLDVDKLAEQVAQNPGVLAASSALSSNAATQPSPTPMGNAIVMLVRSDAPEQTEKQLTSYFNARQMQWRVAQLPAEPAQNEPADVPQPIASAKDGAATFGRNRQNATANVEQEKQQGALQNSQNAVAGALAGKGSGPGDAGGEAFHEYRGSGLNRAAGTQPAQNELAKREASTPLAAAGSNFAQQSQLSNGEQAAQQTLAGDNASNNYRSNGVYVVQMSRRQAVLLCTTLSNERSQAAQTKDVSGLANNNSNADAMSLRRAPKPQALSGLARDSGLRDAIDEKSADDKLPTTRPAEIATADQPGPGSARGEDKSLAFGVTAAPLAKAIGATTAPSTQPVDAATAASTTQPSEEAVSVVILVEGNHTPATLTTVPFTQPALQSEPLQLPAAPPQPQQNAK